MCNNNFKINILTTDGPQYSYLIHKIESKYCVNLVIIEPGRSQRKKLISKRKYRRYFYNRYQNLIRILSGYKKYRNEYFNFNGTLHNKPIIVSDINSDFVINLLKQNPCNLYIVMGTSILSKEIIDICNTDIINIHGGYLPYYRGNNCIFFAYLNNDFEKIGNTIHYIDKGIDTGDIIEVVVPIIDSEDNPEILYCKAKKMVIDRLIDLINEYEKGILKNRIPQDINKGKLYKTEDRNIKTDIIYFWKNKIKKFLHKS